MAVMTVQQFIDKLMLAVKSDTLYVMGGFGAPLTPANKVRYINKNNYNRKRKNMIDAASSSTFAFDCVNLGKGILWGWRGDKTKTNGGASYGSNGVADTNADGMFNNYCYDKSSDFKHLEIGEFLWMSGHCGYYIGNGLAVECSPKWKNKVQITAVGNLGKKPGYNTRTWKKHGKLKYLDYSAVEKYVPVYRLYNPHGKHCFTTSAGERANLIQLGWKDEGTAWYAPVSGDPVYRLYNRVNGDHLLTTRNAERLVLKALGLKDEGTKFYSDPDKDVPVWRVYNENSGEHFYTTNPSEYNALVRLGWTGEDIAFYASKKG